MTDPDSFDRIVTYFHALARSPFWYKGREYVPYNRLTLSEKCFRDFTCPEGCGACCMKCSLVWDAKPEGVAGETVEEGEVEVNGRAMRVFVDAQFRNDGRFCRHLTATGRCGIYSQRPLPCRFELFKFTHVTSRSTAYASVRLPGRNWALTRVDGEKGARCEIRPYSKDLTAQHARDVEIISGWMDQFEIQHDGHRLHDYLVTGPHSHPLVIERRTAQRQL